MCRLCAFCICVEFLSHAINSSRRIQPFQRIANSNQYEQTKRDFHCHPMSSLDDNILIMFEYELHGKSCVVTSLAILTPIFRAFFVTLVLVWLPNSLTHLVWIAISWGWNLNGYPLVRVDQSHTDRWHHLSEGTNITGNPRPSYCLTRCCYSIILRAIGVGFRHSMW